MINNMIMKKFFGLNSQQKLPFYVRMYMTFPFAGSRELRYLQDNFQRLLGDSPYTLSLNISQNVMNAVKQEQVVVQQGISNVNWIGVGILLMSSLIALSFSEYFQWLIDKFGSIIEISLYGVMGIAITAYAVMFIASRIDAFKKYILK